MPIASGTTKDENGAFDTTCPFRRKSESSPPLSTPGFQPHINPVSGTGQGMGQALRWNDRAISGVIDIGYPADTSNSDEWFLLTTIELP